MRDNMEQYLGKQSEWIATFVEEIRFHPYHHHSELSVFQFTNLIDKDGVKSAKHIYLNKSKTTVEANLTRGDVIRFKAKVYYYRSGNNYNRLSGYRTAHHDYKLLYPKDIEIIDKVTVPEREVLDLETLKVYPSFIDYVSNVNYPISKEEIECRKIHILDNDYPNHNVFNTRGEIKSKLYPVLCMYFDTFKDGLTDTQQNKLLDCRKYYLHELQEFFALLRE